MIYDYAVIAGYFLLVVGIGFTFKKMAAKSLLPVRQVRLLPMALP